MVKAEEKKLMAGEAEVEQSFRKKRLRWTGNSVMSWSKLSLVGPSG